MIRTLAAALAAFALISFGARAEETTKAPAVVETPKAEAKEGKAEKKVEKKEKKHHKKAEKTADKAAK